MVHGALQPGGSGALAELIDKHGEAVEATLAAAGVDLYDVLRGEVPAAKAMRLLRWSPPGSAFRASIAGGPDHMLYLGGGHLVANVFDVIAAANTVQGKKPPTHPRPGGRQKQGRTLTNLMSTMLGRKKGGDGA